jgi:hypothetical protein
MTTGDDKLLLANPLVVRSNTTCYQLLYVHNVTQHHYNFIVEIFS